MSAKKFNFRPMIKPVTSSKNDRIETFQEYVKRVRPDLADSKDAKDFELISSLSDRYFDFIKTKFNRVLLFDEWMDSILTTWEDAKRRSKSDDRKDYKKYLEKYSSEE